MNRSNCFSLLAVRGRRGHGGLPVRLALALLLSCMGSTAALAQATAVFSYAQSVVGGTLSGPGGVTVDRSGNLYIADAGGNAVWKVPPTDRTCATPGDCTQIAAGANLKSPYDVALDSTGNLYIADYGNHRVLKVPPTDPSCSVAADCVSIATGFHTPAAGGFPNAPVYGPIGLTVDASDNLYIADHDYAFFLKVPPTDQSCSNPGDCIQIAPSFTFVHPNAVTLDAAGNLYLTNYGGSEIVLKVPPTDLTCATAGDCTTVLSALPTSTGTPLTNPWGVSVDDLGNLYVVDSSSDTRLIKVPPTDPMCTALCTTVGTGLSFSSGVRTALLGNVYIADTANARVVREQTRGVSFDTVPVGTTSGIYSLTYTFTAPGTLGGVSVLTMGTAGLDFADAGTGSCTMNGSTHVYAAGDTCTVDVHVTPARTGLRQGAVELQDAAGQVIATAYVYVFGSGAQVAFSPAAQRTWGSGLSRPDAIALDGNGNLYIADTDDNRVLKVEASDPSCSAAADCIAVGSGLSQPYGVALDGNGNLYISDSLNDRVLKVPSTDPSCATPGDCVPVGVGLSHPEGVAVDGSGNLYIADTAHNRVLEIPPFDLSCATASDCRNVGTGLDAPADVLVDDSGNVYIADSGNNRVLEVPPWDLPCTTATDCTAVGGGLSAPSGMALDGSGTLYIADTGNGRVLRIPPSDPTCSGGDCTAVGSGSSSPSGLAVDGDGDVYVADPVNDGVTEEEFSSPPTLSFAATPVGTADSAGPQTVTVYDIGDAPLILEALASGKNPSISQPFAFTTPDTCPVATASSGAATLAAGASCTLAVTFDPTAAGSPSGTVTLIDDDLNAISAPYATQLIQLTGTGTAQPLDFTLIAENPTTQSVSAGATASYTLQVAPTNTAYPGEVTFTASNLPAGAIATFGPSSVAANAGTQRVTLQVQTAVTAANIGPSRDAGAGADTVAAMPLTAATIGFASLILPWGQRRRTLRGRRAARRGKRRSRVCAALAIMACLTGCGGPNGFFAPANPTHPASHTYAITVTATSGSVQHSVVVNLTLSGQ